ncbi:MAG: MBL fold metallo-hydrolase [Gemmatimonadaceae bacterium]
MLLKRFYDPKLAQASYLLGCHATGEALVVDANRDIDQYIEGAEAENLRITHVTETHIHADFVSGSRELAARTGATLYLSDEGDADWKYSFAAAAGAVPLKDGGSFAVGNVRVDVMHTPGHTPEHLSFLITDTPASSRPMGAFTGDFIFAGDVGRPDLLEKAANAKGTMESAARTLFRSVQRFRALPDYLQLWPGHGAGSACGKSLSAMPQSTIGYENISNWALLTNLEDEFVRVVLSGQPDPPAYFAQMKRINKEGPRLLGGVPRPQRIPETKLSELLSGGALVVDTRPAADFAAGHVPGTINIPLNKSFTTWAGWLLPYGRELYLLTDERCPTCVDEAVRDLALIGLDDVAGYFNSEVLETWAAEGETLATVAQLSPDEVRARIDQRSAVVLDVRAPSEWEHGHLPGVRNVPLGALTDEIATLPRNVPLVTQCQSGARSAIAASVLRAHGFKDVSNLAGGYAEWVRRGLPVERDG